MSGCLVKPQATAAEGTGMSTGTANRVVSVLCFLIRACTGLQLWGAEHGEKWEIADFQFFDK